MEENLIPREYPTGKKELLFGLCALLSAMALCNFTIYGGFNLGFSLGASLCILCSTGYLLCSRRKLRFYPTAILALCLVIAASFARSDDGFVKFVMVCFLTLGSSLGLCLLAGQNRRDPGRPGTLLLAIRDTDGNLLRLFSFPASYSNNPDELFRHDIPGAVSDWIRETSSTSPVGNFPHGAPFFAIKCGNSHQYFNVSIELQFSSSGTDGAVTETLLKRHYKVQAFEDGTGE